MAASAGILVADFAPSCRPALGRSAGDWLHSSRSFRGNSLAVYALVAGAFFSLHSVRTTESAGMRLARQLGSEPQPVTVLGSVVSEPKISAKGFASFLLRLDSIEHEGRMIASNATLLVRWRGTAGVRKSGAPFRRGGAHRAAA